MWFLLPILLASGASGADPPGDLGRRLEIGLDGGLSWHRTFGARASAGLDLAWHASDGLAFGIAAEYMPDADRRPWYVAEGEYSPFPLQDLTRVMGHLAFTLRLTPLRATVHGVPLRLGLRGGVGRVRTMEHETWDSWGFYEERESWILTQWQRHPTAELGLDLAILPVGRWGETRTLYELHLGVGLLTLRPAERAARKARKEEEATPEWNRDPPEDLR